MNVLYVPNLESPKAELGDRASLHSVIHLPTNCLLRTDHLPWTAWGAGEILIVAELTVGRWETVTGGCREGEDPLDWPEKYLSWDQNEARWLAKRVERTFQKEKNNKCKPAEKPWRVPGKEVTHCAWQGREEVSFEREAGFDQAGLSDCSQSLNIILHATGAHRILSRGVTWSMFSELMSDEKCVSFWSEWEHRRNTLRGRTWRLR